MPQHAQHARRGRRHRTGPLDDTIAVVGMACRFPGGIDSPEGLWEALAAGRDLVGEVPPDRFDARFFTDPRRRRPGKSRTAAGGFLDSVAEFDAGYFGIAPREAARIDPQQRLLLETAVEAVDDAGLCREEWEGTATGVFVGISSRDYGDLQTNRPGTIDTHTMTGMATAIAANRISHHFDWHGESVALDTACSSALTAVHRACAHLRAGIGPAALAGGVNVLLNPFGFAGFSAASMLSPTGRCRPFSAAADGYVRAEGAAVVVLKRLSDALAAGDRVHGLIVATGTNCDGRTRGLALPDRASQQALLEEVYGGAGIAPDDLVYLEVHGTGTPAGDPVECEAVGRALGSRRADGALPVGSVKSNLGHLEAAAGMAGLVKALLVLRHGTVPPTLHAEPLSPAIDFAGLGLRPALRSEPLAERPRPVVGVNSFGFGGANAHAVVAPAPDARAGAVALPAPRGNGRPNPLPVVVTAHTAPALTVAARRMADRLRAVPDAAFPDLAYTACRRRTHHAHRAVVLATGPAEAAEGLAGVADGRRVGTAAAGRAQPCGGIAFAFSGNGSQWSGMGADLLKRDPVFRAELERVDAALRPHLGWSVLDALAEPVGPDRLRRTEVAQPLLYAVQSGLVAVLDALGVRPAGVLGHSVGEVAAARTAGLLDAETAARVVAARSLAQAPTAGRGRMAAVGLPEDEARAAVGPYGGRLVVAAVNSPRDVTLAGDAADLADLGERLAARGVFHRPLDLDYAFHTPAMDPVEEPLRELLGDVGAAAGSVPFASSVTGGLLPGAALDTTYWWHNVRRPVLFGAAARTLLGEGCDVFVEIGPHPVTAGYLTRLTGPDGGRPAVVRTCTRDGDGVEETRRAVSQVLAYGGRVDWGAHFPRPGRVVDLPPVPWQRERHWNGDPGWWLSPTDGDAPPAHPLLGTRLPGLEPSWSGPLDPALLPWLDDHRVGDSVVLPGAAYLEAAFAAAGETFDGPVEVLGLRFARALPLPEEDDAATVRFQVALSDEDHLFRFSARPDGAGDWRLHARARVRPLLDPEPEPAGPPEPAGRDVRVWGAAEHYARAVHCGVSYGPAFRVLDRLRFDDREVHADYTAGVALDGLRAHPVILDAVLQAVNPLLLPVGGTDTPFLPASIDRVRMWRSPSARGRIRLRLRERGPAETVFDAVLLDAQGRTAVEFTGARVRRFAAGGAAPVLRCAETLRARHHPRLPHPAADAPLPPARELAAAVGRWHATADALARETRDRACRLRVLETIAHFTAAAVLRLPAEAGADSAAAFSLDDLVAAGMADRHRRFVAALLPVAAEHGLLTRLSEAPGRPPRWRAAAAPRPGPVLDAALRAFPGAAPLFTLYARCGTHLADVLRGRLDPREILFADPDRHLIDRFYSHLPFMENRLGAARELLRAVVAGWPADRPLRVLEVGGGTGGMTDRLVDVLPADRTEYVFTDVSPAFFPTARRRFSGHDVIRYELLDLNRPAGGQGFAEASFDVVVAHHSLHVARDVRQAVDGLARLLAPGGLLVAVEMHDTASTAAFFGPLEEFWSFTDTGLRPDSPLLPPERWEELLTVCGFEDVMALGADPADPTPTTTVLTGRRPRGGAVARPAPPPPAKGRWVIAAEQPDGAPARELAALLADAGAAVHRTAPPRDAAGWARAWAAPAGEEPCRVVLLTDGEPLPADPAARTAHAVRRTAVLAALARAYAVPGAAPVSALWLVTPAGAVLPGPAEAVRPDDAVPWAAARCLATEHPALTVRRIAVAPGTGVERLALDLLDPDDEDEVLLTPGGRFAARVRPLPPPRRESRPAPYRLEVHDPGLSHRLAWAPAAPPATGPHGVRIEVRAAGLNYRDVMESVGLLRPGSASVTEQGQCLGLECAGVVTAVGPEVTGLAPGDRVCAMAPRSLASHVVADRRLTGRIPDGMGFAAAATLPVVWLTVHHALEHLARLAPGETLLLHGAAGGVGLAALRFARARGARVIATAGTPAKRDLLRLLGAEHVLDSRDLAFPRQVRELTDGRGVDVVLNSLAGEALVRSAELLRAGGRFVELGKRDIEGDGRLPMALFHRSLSFFAMDLNQLLQADALPPQVPCEVFDRVREGAYAPLPREEYPADRVYEAFRALRHSRHVGKVVVTFDEPPPVGTDRTPPGPDPDASYLVVGGLSGLGAAFARHLADSGARHLVLAGRRGEATPGARELVDELAGRGARATVRAADVCDPADVAALVRDARVAGRPLKGVVHAAIALDDAPLAELTEDRIRTALAPKMLGGLLLDAATAGDPLDFFVCCTSLAAVVGNNHQAGYAAGNLFLDALARSRRAAGRHGLSVAWGVIGDTGYVSRTGLDTVLVRSGLGALTAAEACSELDTLLAADATAVSAARPDWARLATRFPVVSTPRFAGLFTLARTEREDSARRLRRRLAEAGPDEARELVAETVSRAIADVLQTDPGRLDRQRPLDRLGLDSLMAAELVGVLARRLGCEIPAVELMDARSITSLAERALTRLGRGTPTDAGVPAGNP
ncbi:SDR family NAD(P)-dependent oxidoreductase [Streptomyces sp. NPDC021100]|uniref:SDR family NAD(P)-dependent oxidoreductase n=1 Tax=Streptomyces sp. NPDC021100 TaxID=3365114 RepID=UPI0037BA2147